MNMGISMGITTILFCPINAALLFCSISSCFPCTERFSHVCECFCGLCMCISVKYAEHQSPACLPVLSPFEKENLPYLCTKGLFESFVKAPIKAQILSLSQRRAGLRMQRQKHVWMATITRFNRETMEPTCKRIDAMIK